MASAGLGIIVNRRASGALIVDSVYPDGAARLHATPEPLRAGDTIIMADGSWTNGKTVAELASILRGPAGTSVELVVMRDKSANPLTIKIQRVQPQSDDCGSSSNGSVNEFRQQQLSSSQQPSPKLFSLSISPIEKPQVDFASQQSRMDQSKITQLTTIVSKLKDQNERLLKELEAERGKVLLLQSQQEDRNAGLATRTLQAKVVTLEAQIEDLHKANTRVKKEAENAKNSAKFSKMDMERLESEVQAELHRAVTIESKINSINEAKAAVEEVNAKLQEERDAMERSLLSSRTTEMEHKKTVDHLERKLYDVETSYEELKARYAQLEVELQQKAENILDLEREKDEIRKIVDYSDWQTVELKNDNNKLKAEMTSMQEQIDSLQSYLPNIEAKYKQIEIELAEREKIVSEKEKDLENQTNEVERKAESLEAIWKSAEVEMKLKEAEWKQQEQNAIEKLQKLQEMEGRLAEEQLELKRMTDDNMEKEKSAQAWEAALKQKEEELRRTKEELGRREEDLVWKESNVRQREDEAFMSTEKLQLKAEEQRSIGEAILMKKEELKRERDEIDRNIAKWVALKEETQLAIKQKEKLAAAHNERCVKVQQQEESVKALQEFVMYREKMMMENEGTHHGSNGRGAAVIATELMCAAAESDVMSSLSTDCAAALQHALRSLQTLAVQRIKEHSDAEMLVTVALDGVHDVMAALTATLVQLQQVERYWPRILQKLRIEEEDLVSAANRIIQISDSIASIKHTLATVSLEEDDLRQQLENCRVAPFLLQLEDENAAMMLAARTMDRHFNDDDDKDNEDNNKIDDKDNAKQQQQQQHFIRNTRTKLAAVADQRKKIEQQLHQLHQDLVDAEGELLACGYGRVLVNRDVIVQLHRDRAKALRHQHGHQHPNTSISTTMHPTTTASTTNTRNPGRRASVAAVTYTGQVCARTHHDNTDVFPSSSSSSKHLLLPSYGPGLRVTKDSTGDYRITRIMKDCSVDASVPPLAIGDVVVKVDGKLVRSMVDGELIRTLSGECNSNVSVTVVHEGKERTILLARSWCR